MAVTNQQIIDYLLANPNLSDAEIVTAMEKNGISPAQMASAVNLPEGQIAARVGATLPPNQAVLLGDTYVQAVNPIQGSGENEQVGALENVITYKASENKPGGNIQYYSPTGEYQQTTQQQKVDTSFGGAIKDIVSNPGFKIIAAAYGLDAALGMFGGAGAATAAGAEAATAFELANAGIAGGTAAFTPAQLALIEAGATAAEVTAAGAGGGLLTGGADVTTNTARELAASTAVTPTTLTPAAVTPAATSVISPGGVPEAVSNALTKVGTGVATGLLTTGLADTVSGALQTGGSLLQSQESKDAALKAATDITKATQAGVEGSQFRPVGMTTRFGTSNYTYDPVTGRMTSAGYQLSPDAKLAQDRLVKLADRGLYQAEAAQEQFKPLQTAAQNLYSLGSKYIAKSPEEAAQDYINKQMQLIAPSREMDLANLQNRLFQQGRTGVSVAQGGSLGATTPELQALYNARAQQELQLAANAQREGRENTLFGSNLYDLGTAKLSNYYGGQTQAYAPYTTALGQVQALESLGQQPLQMGANLAQQASAAGARSGMLGLEGQRYASAFNTGANATYNPYAGLLTAAGNPSSMFGQSIAKYLSGTTATPYDALSSTKYGDGLAGYEKMIADIYGT